MNVPTTVVCIVTGGAKNYDFSYFLFINMSMVHLRGLRSKRKKICLQPCRFRGGFTRDWRGYSQKINGSEKE
jgi:hypothetical protein